MHNFAALGRMGSPVNTQRSHQEIIRLGQHPVKLNIRQHLERINFVYHRPCSVTKLNSDCNSVGGHTLVLFGNKGSQMTMSISNASSLHRIIQNTSQSRSPVRSAAQQTEITCRHTPEEHRLLQSIRLVTPASSLIAPPQKSTSIFNSVCALLLNKPDASDNAKVVSNSSVNSDNICRICFGGGSTERLVRPCLCRGTIAAVHRSCLERWLLQAATSYCELCRHHYLVTRSHKWPWLRSLLEWARSGHGGALVADVCRGVALGAASVVVTSRALSACDRVLQAGAKVGGGASIAANVMSSLVIGIIGALNGLLTTWMLLKIQEHHSSWLSWRASSLTVHVTLAEELVTLASQIVTPQPSVTTIVTEGTIVHRGTNVSHVGHVP